VPSPSTIAAFAAASIVLLLIPGPAVLYIVNRSVSEGRVTGLASAGGVAIGNLFHAVAAAVGLTAVIRTSVVAFETVKWLGAGYLVFVGIRTLTRGVDPIVDDQVQVRPRAAFAQGIVVNVFNPKVALFFLSYLPTFIHPDEGSAGVQALVLGLVFVTLGFCSDSCYALLASGLRDVMLRGRALPFVRRWVAGTVFVGLGVLAATGSASTSTAKATG
jgi:threonine/homoserine/homoserine lactone efflux protein